MFIIRSLCVQYCNLNRLAHEVGWKYQKVVGTLEARRKVKSKQFFERKRKLQVCCSTLDHCANKSWGLYFPNDVIFHLPTLSETKVIDTANLRENDSFFLSG